MIALKEAKEWLRIDEDYDQEDNLVTSLINASISDIKSSTGVPKEFLKNILDEDDEVKNLYIMAQKIFINDMYYEKDTENKSLLSYYTKLELAYRRLLR